MKRLAAFDLDGTLIDSRHDIANAINETLKRFHQEPLSVEKVISFVGNGSRLLIQRAIAGKDLPEDGILAAFQEEYLRHAVVETRLYPGVADTLKLLKDSGWDLAVLSNKPVLIGEKILNELGIRDLFSHNIGGGSSFPLKPDPAAYNFLLTETGSSRKESWMVGDHYTDIATGINAGVRTAFATYGIGHKKEELPTAEFDSFVELLSIFQAKERIAP